MSTTVVDLPVHKVASLFPEMTKSEYSDLLEDIRANGLYEPIWLHEGQVIDGRHRYKACLELGIEPKTRNWNGEGSLVRFVAAMNLKRRYLTASQRAAVGAQMMPMLRAEAKERQQGGQGGVLLPSLGTEAKREESRNVAAAAAGVGPRYIQEATRVMEEAPKLFEMVALGVVTLPGAIAITDLPEDMAQEVIATIEAEPETLPKRIIQKAVWESNAKAVASIPDEDGSVSRALVNLRYLELETALEKALRAIDPETLISVNEISSYDRIRSLISKMQKWTQKVEEAMNPPIRLVQGGRRD